MPLVALVVSAGTTGRGTVNFEEAKRNGVPTFVALKVGENYDYTDHKRGPNVVRFDWRRPILVKYEVIGGRNDWWLARDAVVLPGPTHNSKPP